jgi:hypothetical protein
VLAGVGLIACESSASPPVVETHGAVLAPTVLLAPRATPRGWFVSSVENYSRSDRMEQTLYARADDRDLRHADGILVGEGGARLDLPHPGRAATRVGDLGPGHASGRIAHFGAYTVLSWHREPRRTTFVIGRGFRDEDIGKAARAAEFYDAAFPARAPTIPARALPARLRRVAETPLLPRESRRAPESILLVSAHGRRFVRILAYRLDAVARGVDDFLAGVAPNRPREPSVERRVGATTLLVRGNARRAVINALVRSVAPRSG